MNNYMKGDIYIDLDYGTRYTSIDDSKIAGTQGNDTMIFTGSRYNTVYAGSGDDKITLTSGANNNVIYAESGNDFIGARFAKNPKIYGGKGKDTIRAYTDKLYADGGEDNDLLIPFNCENVTMIGGAGDDTFWFIENSDKIYLTGGSGSDVYRFDPYYVSGPFTNNVVITDLSSEDIIRNDAEDSNGTELVISKSGDDIILKDSESGYGNFNITLKGGMDNLEEISEVMYRSTDLDAKLGEIFPDFFADGDEENSGVSLNSKGTSIKILESYDDGEFYASDYGKKIVTVDGSAAGNKIEIYGNALANKIIGSKYKDILHGGNGKDTLYGGKGNDKFFGDAGNDKLFGDAGNDTLNGGKGNDTLKGGAGKDTFVYAKSTGKDVITDYTAGQDKIKISSGSINKIRVSGKNVIFTVGNGTITVKNGKNKIITVIDANGKTNVYKNNKKTSSSKSVSELWFAEENNFVSSDNLSSITENNLTPSALEKITTTNFENLTQENNFVTYSEK